LPALATTAKGLRVVVDFYPGEERALNVYEVPATARVPAAPRGHAAAVLSQAGTEPVPVTLVGREPAHSTVDSKNQRGSYAKP
jgi:hypothetical protein